MRVGVVVGDGARVPRDVVVGVVSKVVSSLKPGLGSGGGTVSPPEPGSDGGAVPSNVLPESWLYGPACHVAVSMSRPVSKGMNIHGPV